MEERQRVGEERKGVRKRMRVSESLRMVWPSSTKNIKIRSRMSFFLPFFFSNRRTMLLTHTVVSTNEATLTYHQEGLVTH